MKNKGSEPNINHQKKERTEVFEYLPTQGHSHLLPEKYQQQKVSPFRPVYQPGMH